MLHYSVHSFILFWTRYRLRNRNIYSYIFQIFERETRREKILEARHREIKLKQRAKSAQGDKDDDEKEGDYEDEDLVSKAETEFYDIIEKEKKTLENKRKDQETESSEDEKADYGKVRQNSTITVVINIKLEDFKST